MRETLSRDHIHTPAGRFGGPGRVICADDRTQERLKAQIRHSSNPDRDAATDVLCGSATKAGRLIAGGETSTGCANVRLSKLSFSEECRS